jgi:hypothetical protein
VCPMLREAGVSDRPFIRFDAELVRRAIGLELDPIDLAILLVIEDRRNQRTGESFAAPAKIPRSLYRVSARTVRRRIPRLRDRGLLVVERRHDQRGYRRPSGIRLNVPPRSDLPATGGQEDDLPATPGHKDRLPATGARRRRAYRPNATRLPATGGRSYRPRVAAQNMT